MPECIACGDKPTITAESLQHYDYGAFTGAPSNDAAPQPLQLLPEEDRISAAQVCLACVCFSPRINDASQAATCVVEGQKGLWLCKSPHRYVDNILSWFVSDAASSAIGGEAGHAPCGRAAH